MTKVHGLWLMGLAVALTMMTAFAAPALALEPDKFIAPNLQVNIPGVSFEDTVTIGDGTNGCDDGYVCVNTITTYLNAIYKWGAGAGAIFAIALIMIGGIEWMIGSAVGTIERAKTRIRNASFGLLLVLVTTVFLQFINPDIVALRPVRIEYIDPIRYVNASGDVAANATPAPVAITAVTAVAEAQAADSIPATDTGKGTTVANMSRIGLACPKTGGSAVVTDLAKQFVGKVSYRLGGKGSQIAPFTWELPPNRAERYVKRDAEGTPYGYYCPDDTMCLDCSGYVQLVSTCAGLAPRGNSSTGTIDIFRTAPHIINCDQAKGSVILEDGTEHILEPGDWLGFGIASFPSPMVNGFNQPLEKVPDSGHVWLYIGDGILSNSAARRAKGQAIREQTLGSVCAHYPLQLRAIGT